MIIKFNDLVDKKLNKFNIYNNLDLTIFIQINLNIKFIIKITIINKYKI